MIKYYIYIIIFFVSFLRVYGQEGADLKDSHKTEKTKLNDGSYIFIEKDRLIEKKIVNGQVFTKKKKFQYF